MEKIKISELAEASESTGLWVLVTDSQNRSRKFCLDNLASHAAGSDGNTAAGSEGSGGTTTTQPDSRSMLDSLIYARCGNDDDPQMQLPAIIRHTPATYEAIDTATQYAIPRVILYLGGTLYDNAPQGYQGGVAETVQRPSPIAVMRAFFRLTDQPSPYSSTALGCLQIVHQAGATVGIAAAGTYYYIDTTHAQPQIQRASVLHLGRLRITSNSTVEGMTISERMRTQARVGHTQATSQASANVIAETSPVGILSLLS